MITFCKNFFDTNDLTIIVSESCDERVFRHLAKNRIDLVISINQANSSKSFSTTLKDITLQSYDEKRSVIKSTNLRIRRNRAARKDVLKRQLAFQLYVIQIYI